MNIYDFTVKKQDGAEQPLSAYKGDVVLIVNTATECGFTPQYEQLEELYEKYKDRGFVILDFPCNQFGHQAPGTDDEIRAFCSSRFGVTFPIFHKIDVNGSGASPLFTYLKEQQGFKGFDYSDERGEFMDGHLKKVAGPDYAKSDDIKWNFTKFLIGRDGEVLQRFEPTESMEKVDKAVAAQL